MTKLPGAGCSGDSLPGSRPGTRHLARCGTLARGESKKSHKRLSAVTGRVTDSGHGTCYVGVSASLGAPGPYGCGFLACRCTLAGVARGRSAVLSPRCAALQQCCVLPQLRVGTSLASRHCQWGTLGHCESDPRVGLARVVLGARACAVMEKRIIYIHVYWLNYGPSWLRYW